MIWQISIGFEPIPSGLTIDMLSITLSFSPNMTIDFSQVLTLFK